MLIERGQSGMDLLNSLEKAGVLIGQARLIVGRHNLQSPDTVDMDRLISIPPYSLRSGTLPSHYVFCDHPELGLSLVPPVTALNILRDALHNPNVEPFYKLIGMKPIRYNRANIGVLAIGCTIKEDFKGYNTWVPRKEFYLDVHWLHGTNYANFGSPIIFQRT